MARIGLAWEMGSALGHVARLNAFAKALVSAGHEVTMALKNPAATDRLPVPEGVRVVAAPPTPGSAPLARPLYSHAEVLALSGFGDSAALAARLQRWKSILTDAGTELLIADHAPTALLSARLLGLKTIATGNPFAVVPAREPLPSFLTPALPDAEVLAFEHALVGKINSAIGHEALKSLHEVFAADLQSVTSFPELDPWQRAPESVEYWGPMPPESGAVPDWPDGEGARVFAYLHDFTGRERLLDALRDRAGPTLAYIPGLGAEQARRWGGGNLKLAQRPVDIPLACSSARLLICHSPQGTALHALMTGCPVLIIPLQVEQLLNAGAMRRTGAVYLANIGQDADPATALAEALADTTMADAARTFSASHAESARNPAQLLVKAVARLLA